MAYKIMKSLISNSTKSNEELSNMADVYYGSGRMTDKQHSDITKLIEQREEA